ncbi:DUF3040 domain-containing protein [Actinopolyspora erythraea]|uniref:DUF3040 domain-containing protein n=1 Tax=Actinopolyspora erythraea TaxID=414996 RepID=A0A099D7Y0_9ACTN|nr:DUF3040 domain-containing protein [Actinopolyspora erythraea]ASU78730.1 DUF3040 domain-containing protein [Actinopolyspora erythraea]KGI81485.1 hypothetical protein IL38_11145 [Actinopolyspora erythraea]
MLGNYERRSLEEIENRLTQEDPELARGLAEGRPRTLRRRFPPLLVLAGVALALSVTLLVLAEFGAALLAVVLAAGLSAFWYWRSRT